MKNIHICTILGYSKIMSIFYLRIASILLFHARKIVWIEDWSIYMFLFDAVFLQLLPFLFSHKFNLISEYRKTTIFDSLRIEEIFMYNPWICNISAIESVFIYLSNLLSPCNQKQIHFDIFEPITSTCAEKDIIEKCNSLFDARINKVENWSWSYVVENCKHHIMEILCKYKDEYVWICECISISDRHYSIQDWDKKYYL